MNNLTAGIKDDQFIRGQVPMTKEEVRVITLSKLNLQENDVVVDIGAGTGSISIECGVLLKKGHVYAVERNKEAIKLIHQNIKRFSLENVTVLEEYAPKGLEQITFNKAVIGGSGGQMTEIIDCLTKHQVKKIVVNTITVENTYLALQALKSLEYQNIEVMTVNISKNKFVGDVTMMIANNPITIITGEKL